MIAMSGVFAAGVVCGVLLTALVLWIGLPWLGKLLDERDRGGG